MGTDAWRNWRDFNAAKPETENVEVELHSDRQFTAGPATLGPYVASAILAGASSYLLPPTVGPAVRLHVGVHTHLIPDIVIDGELAPANSSAYHGGNDDDEIAALVCLELGVRLRVAGTTQLSGIHDNDDPGENRTPIYLSVTPLAHPGTPGREIIPALLSRPAALDDIERLRMFPDLGEKAQVELVRAARSYAAGVWWANEDANRAWLHLVTAVEIAANQRQSDAGDPVAMVEQTWPEMWDVLRKADPMVQTGVAKKLAPQMRATKKFVDFLVACAPDPPARRPQFDQLDWSSMRKHAGLIYRHRSGALHEGKPFPLPMLENPRVDEDGAIQEVPTGLNSGGQGGIWDREETPMLLSTFEYLTRGALLSWWDELVDEAARPRQDL